MIFSKKHSLLCISILSIIVIDAVIFYTMAGAFLGTDAASNSLLKTIAVIVLCLISLYVTCELTGHPDMSNVLAFFSVAATILLFFTFILRPAAGVAPNFSMNAFFSGSRRPLPTEVHFPEGAKGVFCRAWKPPAPSIFSDNEVDSQPQNAKNCTVLLNSGRAYSFQEQAASDALLITRKSTGVVVFSSSTDKGFISLRKLIRQQIIPAVRDVSDIVSNVKTWTGRRKQN